MGQTQLHPGCYIADRANGVARGLASAARSLAHLVRAKATEMACCLLVFGALCLVGCNDSKEYGSGGGGTVATPVTPPTTPTAVPTNYDVIRRGNAPISYVIGPSARIVLFDITRNQQILSRSVQPQTLLEVESAAGVSINGTVVVAGPLPATSVYELRLLRGSGGSN